MNKTLVHQLIVGNTHTRTALLACGMLISASLATQAVPFSTGFESDGYTGGTTTGANQLVPQQGWETQFGDTNFDVYTYVGNEVAYTPSGEVPDIGGTSQLVTFPQNPTGGSQFVAAGNGNGRDMHAADYTSSAEGLVEISVDYHPGDWFDNSGGNYNGALTIRPGNTGGFYTGRGSEQEPGDANGNGPWAPAFQVWDKDNTKLINHGIGYRFDEVDGFDNLTRSWHRIGVVIDTDTGIVTQLKSQELTPGGTTKFIDNPRGPGEEVLYLESGEANTNTLERIGIYNVGNGSLSAFDNIYVGPPYEWPVVHDLPFNITEIDYASTTGMLTLTWNSRPNETYGVYLSTDMIDWGFELDDSIPADAVETTTTVTFDLNDTWPGPDGIPESVYFRVEK